MRDNREFKYCQTCKVYKLPRMHHCSVCNACTVKYDHHCGMVMNCVGVNNYHLFLQFMVATILHSSLSLYLNLKYNVYVDYYSQTTVKKGYLAWTAPAVFSMALVQVGVGVYAGSLLRWYAGMASRNMHAIEESLAGTVYNRADYWGVTAKNAQGQEAQQDTCCSNHHS